MDDYKRTSSKRARHLEDLGTAMAVSYENMMQELEQVMRFEKDLFLAKERLFEATKRWEKASSDLRCAMDEVNVEEIMTS